MKALLPCLLSLALLAGCAAHDRESDRQNKLWSQNEQRLKLLESNITQLNEQVSLLNNRVYEVRSAKGRKTGMTVVPVVPVPKAAAPQPSPKASAAPAPASSQPKAMQQRPKVQNPPKAQAQAKTPVKQEARPAPRHASQNTPKTPEPASVALPPTDNQPLSTGDGPALPPTLPLEGTLSLPAQTEEPKVQAPLLPPDTASQPAPKATAAPKASASEEASYKQALKAARSGRPQEGIQKFREFLNSYPNGKYAPNAEFWIGECLYDQGKYQEALSQYEAVGSKYPKHHKNADALLKSGMSYKRLGNKDKAKDSYGRLLKEFPNSEAARRARGAR